MKSEEEDIVNDLEVCSPDHRGGTSYFQGAHDLTLTNLSITNIQGNIVNRSPQLSGFAALHQQISHNAMFDSAVRYPAGRCHPGTREKIIETILAWTNEPSMSEPVLWLYGPAGAGKSAIMQTVAEILANDHKERYAGSFFFGNGVVGRQEGSALFPTLSYQIAVNIPEVRPLIDKAMNYDLSLPAKSIPIQLRHLLLDPLTILNKSESRHSPTVVIDGLDECQGSAIQCQILACIADAVNGSKRLPLRFLIASRPEYWLKDAFERDPLCVSTQRVSLHVLDHETYLSVHSDIERFLVDGFESILFNNSRIMADVQKPWPSPDVIKSLVLQASGQFIYASTILKFVGNSSDFCDPVTQLRIITHGDTASRSAAFSELDALYLKILSAYPRPESLKSVLAGLLLHMTSPAIERLLNVDSRELILVLDFLTSILDPNDWDTSKKRLFSDDENLAIAYGHRHTTKARSFSHLSIQEFLQDTRRSGNFYISLTHYREEIATRFFQSIADNLAGLSGLEEHRGFIYNDLYTIIQHETIFEPFCALLEDLYEMLLVFFASQVLSLPRPTTLIRSLRCVEKYLLLLQSVKVNRNIFEKFLDALRNTIYPRIVKLMLSSGSLNLSDNLIYTMGDHIGLKALSEMPGNNLDSATSFLLQNTGIIATSESRIVSFAPGFSTRSYNVIDSIRDVLEGKCLEKVGRFRADYRRLNMEIAQRCLLYLTSDPEQNEIWDIVIEILLRFFNNPRLSDIQDDDDISKKCFLPAINSVLAHNWTKSSRIIDVQWQTLTICLMCWSARQTSLPGSMEILSRCNISAYLELYDFSTKMFEEILPSYVSALLPFLSEILVHSPNHDRWKLPDCSHSPPHRPSPSATDEWELDFDLERPDRERRIVDLLLNLPGNSAPLYSICLAQLFLELYSDKRSSRAWVPGSLPELVSSSLPVRAVETILAALRVVRYISIDN